MLPKSRRPREERIADLTPVTYSIAEFCAITGQIKAAVLCAIDDGSRRTTKLGNRRLILARQPRIRQAEDARPKKSETGRFP